MSNPHETHRMAVVNASSAIGELQEAISVVTDREENAMGAVIMAVGQNPHIESAQNAMNFVARVRALAEDQFTLCEQAKAEIARYAGGF